jgi:hypothetical protein
MIDFNQPTKTISSTIKQIKKTYALFLGSILFFFENYRKRYPYVLLGEKHTDEGGETVLLYRIVGKRHIVEMSAKEICSMKELISNFHPLDVRIICFIAGVEQILNVQENKRKALFAKLKNDIFRQ